MKLVSMKELMDGALAGGYAVGAFNVNNMEYIQAVVEAAAEARSPVIVQAADSECAYMGHANFVQMVKSIGAEYDIPIAIHLDHGSSFESAMRCVRAGFTSVMFDGSKLPYEENVATMKRIVDVCKVLGVTVEGEIGRIGGEELNQGDAVPEELLSDPVESLDFCSRTGIDCLAAAIGTVHGFYKSTPKLDFPRLQKIKAAVKLPIVLHGGTGIPEGDIKQAISLGVAKINFSTVVRHACITQLSKTLEENPGNLDLMFILSKSKQKMKDAIANQIRMCGSAGKA